MNLNVPFNVGDYGVTHSELLLLKKGGFHTLSDILLVTSQDISRKCKLSPLEAKRIVDKILDATPIINIQPADALNEVEVFTTGDETLDKILGGGLRTSMVWEVVGESAAGKTQLALQLSLYVQAPRALGGLGATSCFITTSSTLPTERLLQIAESNGLIDHGCGLEGVHTIAAPTSAVLLHVLSTILPAFVEKQDSDTEARPIKLVVIDALGELFHGHLKTTSSSLAERSQQLVRISAELHRIASRYRICILVLNEVIDVFNRFPPNRDFAGDLLYDDHARWFNSATAFGQGTKDAVLGLVWANQVNARIMLSRTGRRRYLTEEDIPKRMRGQPENPNSSSSDRTYYTDPALIRKLSVLYSSLSLPASVDYIVTQSGISALQEIDRTGIPPLVTSSPSPAETSSQNKPFSSPPSSIPEPPQPKADNPPTDSQRFVASSQPDERDVDEFDALLSQGEGDPYADIDWDALENNLSQIAP